MPKDSVPMLQARSIEKLLSLKYSPARGIFIAHSMIRPDNIQILSMKGSCLGSYTGTVAEEFSWKPHTRGVYIVKIQAGGDEFIARINCVN